MDTHSEKKNKEHKKTRVPFQVNNANTHSKKKNKKQYGKYKKLITRKNIHTNHTDC